MELAVNKFYMTDWHVLLLGKLVHLSDAAFAGKDARVIPPGGAQCCRTIGQEKCSLSHGATVGPAARFVPMCWGEDSLATVTREVVVTVFAHMGVSMAMVDDVFAFSEKWLQQWSEQMSPPPE
ncbi:hypothetical protein B0H17DRAFT_1148672 [Mycena rosella]|uniref:Uncharacterized protein n=1 Tax=Mycena rosella TaxID=1033263 RepID=A0AAD7C9J8_MYCRO|nr:hypothetical protein B0H17DRAFT_1148672 [Mycena rosella]